MWISATWVQAYISAKPDYAKAIMSIAPTVPKMCLKSNSPSFTIFSDLNPMRDWFQKGSVHVRAKKPGIGIPLHKTIDNSLSLIEAHSSWSLDVLLDKVSRDVVDVYLRRDWRRSSENIDVDRSIKPHRDLQTVLVCLPLWELLPWWNAQISSWPLTIAWTNSWFFCSLHKPAKIQCSHRWTRTWGRCGMLPCHLQEQTAGLICGSMQMHLFCVSAAACVWTPKCPWITEFHCVRYQIWL